MSETSPMLGFGPEKVNTPFVLPAHLRTPAPISLGFSAEPGFRSRRLLADTLVALHSDS